ncbi:MAG: HAD-IIA family hydrolase [Candidatus Micrarchaeia archaeon]
MAIKTIIFDLDGVLYRGDEIITGSIETIKKLKSLGIKTYFLTNAGTLSRKGRAKKLRSLGFEIPDDEVFTSSYGIGAYLSSIKKNPSVYCIGEAGLKEELSSFGAYLTEKNTDFVVVGLDREFTYKKLNIALQNIINGAKFIATNGDATFPVENNKIMPGCGSIVSSVAYCSKINPHIIGKPNAYLLDMIISDSKSKRDEILLIGDRIETDVFLAKKAKIKSALVLSGVSTRNDLEKLKEEEKPDYLLNSILGIFNIPHLL